MAGLDSILNDCQFLDPFGQAGYDYLPADFVSKLKNNSQKEAWEKEICQIGLGYKHRLVARKKS